MKPMETERSGAHFPSKKTTGEMNASQERLLVFNS